MDLVPYSSLSPQQVKVLQAVEHHTQMTTSQVRRLLYVGSPEGIRVRSQRHLKRLTDLGLLERMWGVYPITGTAQHIYRPAGRTAAPDQHTLDITELYVRLVESGASVQYDREPWCHVQVGRMELKPDAFCRVQTAGGVFSYFVEVDRGSEHRTQLGKKMRAYVRAFEHEWDVDRDGPKFPRIIWTVPDEDRKRVMQSVIRRQSVQKLFLVEVFDEVVRAMI